VGRRQGGDFLLSREVHARGLPEGDVGKAALRGRAGRARVLRGARRQGPGPGVRRPQAGDDRRADREEPVPRLPRRPAVRPRRQRRRLAHSGRLVLQERQRVPRAHQVGRVRRERWPELRLRAAGLHPARHPGRDRQRARLRAGQATPGDLPDRRRRSGGLARGGLRGGGRGERRAGGEGRQHGRARPRAGRRRAVAGRRGRRPRSHQPRRRLPRGARRGPPGGSCSSSSPRTSSKGSWSASVTTTRPRWCAGTPNTTTAEPPTAPL
jgi:hypothetical protein